MNRDQKAAVVEELTEQIRSAEAIFAVDYRGISVEQAAELRSRLREAQTRFRIVKNSLTERATDQAGADALRPLNALIAGVAIQLKAIADQGLLSSEGTEPQAEAAPTGGEAAPTGAEAAPVTEAEEPTAAEEAESAPATQDAEQPETDASADEPQAEEPKEEAE